MEVEKLNQGELSRIEKYVEGIVRKKISDLQDNSEEKEQALTKVNQNTYLKKLLAKYGASKKKTNTIHREIEAAENRYDIRHSYGNNYDYYFKLGHDWKLKNQEQQDAKIKKVQKAHKEFTEALIFRSKPEILKAIKAIEKI